VFDEKDLLFSRVRMPRMEGGLTMGISDAIGNIVASAGAQNFSWEVHNSTTCEMTNPVLKL